MTPDPSTGQILPGSKFGDKLTELAREAKVIVEIGTWKGGGSTLCLSDGIRGRHGAFLFTLEAERDMFESCPWNHERVFRIWGTIVKPDEFPEFYHFDKSLERRRTYDNDHRIVGSARSHAPYVLQIIPPEIDFLLLDGGEWTSWLEYVKLRDRCKVIALDDTHPGKSIKNYQARDDMMRAGWTVLANEPEDRNGWFIGRRP